MRRSLTLISAAGCLALIHFASLQAPIMTEFFRKLGATEFHIGILGGIPMLAVAAQFMGAVLVRRMPRRKPLWMLLLITGRFLNLPVVLMPLCFPMMDRGLMLTIQLCLLGLSWILQQFGTPLWFSWIGDLIPHRLLNTYWGVRFAWIHVFWILANAGVTIFTYCADRGFSVLGHTFHLDTLHQYALLGTVSVMCGIADIVLFVGVKEPPNEPAPAMPLREVILSPLKDRAFRSFLTFSCAFNISTIIAAAFTQVYCLEQLHLSVWKTTLIWCCGGVGIALSSKQWGKIADRHGHRPVLLFCVCFKPIMALTYLLVTPAHAFWVLALVFLVDWSWNAGVQVASNGYMLKLAPRENRSMYVAAMQGASNVLGGLAAVAAGYYLRRISWFSIDLFGRTWNHFHVIFLASFFLRFWATAAAYAIQEPQSTRTRHVLGELLSVWPANLLLLPVDAARRAHRAVWRR